MLCKTFPFSMEFFFYERRWVMGNRVCSIRIWYGIVYAEYGMKLNLSTRHERNGCRFKLNGWVKTMKKIGNGYKEKGIA